MAGRSRSTFGKRQKEQKRLEKRRDKAALKDQRKLEKQEGAEVGDLAPNVLLETLRDNPIDYDAPDSPLAFLNREKQTTSE